MLGVTGIKRVYQPNPGVAEVGNVPRGDSQVMCQRGGCDEAVIDRHGMAAGFQSREESCPERPGRLIEIDNSQSFAACREPFFKPPTFSPGWQKQNSVFHFSKNNRVDGNALFVLAKPIQNPAIRVRLGGFAENIGIDEKLHKESVDSDSIS